MDMNNKIKTVTLSRKTTETDITLSLALGDSSRKSEIQTGIGFFDHMLNAFSHHAGLYLSLSCKGDLEVDCHHTVEDCGIVLGMAINEALCDKSGIARYGSAYIPMDEALAMAAVDISGRPYLVFNAEFSNEKIGDLDCQMVEEFFRALAFNAGITLHLNLLYGKNDHHIAEAIFKAFAHAFKQAAKKAQSDAPLSTKGALQ